MKRRCALLPRNKSGLHLAALLLGSAAILTSLPATAADWTGATSEDWFTTTNWSPNAVPTSVDDVTIDTVSPDSTLLDGANGFAHDIIIGKTGIGVLTLGYSGGSGNTLTNGGDAVIGQGAGSDGTVFVGGGLSSSWSDGGKLVVGDGGNGLLTVLSGGTVSVGGTTYIGGETLTGGSGTALVTGSGASLTSTGDLFVGNSGFGTLSILEGATAGSTASILIGGLAGGDGTISVDDGSTLTAGSSIEIGVQGNGALSVTNGGTVASANGDIGLAAGGTGTASVAGTLSTWTVANTLLVGASGTGTLNVTGEGTVSDTNAVIGSGLGSIGTATVDGSGSIWTSTGSLVVGGTGTGGLTISSQGEVDSASGVVGDVAGSQGSVSITGTGSKWATGALIVGSQGTGTVALDSGGVLSVASLTIGDFGSGTVVVASGAQITGTAVIAIATEVGSAGKLVIGSDTAGSPAAAGLINATLIQFGLGTGTVEFNHTSTNYSFDAVLSGYGTIEQRAGVTVLTADSSAFTGNTNVLGGRLAVNGSLANSLVTVSNGGTLGGTGTVGTLVVESGGIVGPGNSIGTLTVSGAYTPASGSTFQTEVATNGTSDLLAVGGAAAIASGAQLQVVMTGAPASYVVGTQFIVLTATSVSGTYTLTGDTVISPFIHIVAEYDATHVYLDVVQEAAFAASGGTRNQGAVAGGLDSLPGGSPLFTAVTALPTNAAALAAFDQLSGEEHASLKGSLIQDSGLLRQAALDRLRAAFGGVGAPAGPVFLYGESGPAKPEGLAVWGWAFGAWGSNDGDGNAAGFSRNTQGFVFGIDALFAESFRAGFLAGYSHSSFDVDARASSGSSDDFHVGLYGGGQWGPIGLRGGLAYSLHQIETSRNVAFGGFGNTLKGDYDAGTFQAFAEAGYRFDLTPAAAIEPFAGLALVDLHTDAFSETGGAAALTSTASDTQTAFTTLGLHSSYAFDLNGMPAAVRGTIGWRHAFGDVTPLADLAFAGGSSFTVAGVPIARDAAVIEAGLDVSFSQNVKLSIAYDGQFAADARDNGFKSEFSWKF